MGRGRKDEDARAGEDFDERALFESSESSENEMSISEKEVESESELSGDEAVERLKQLESEYRRSIARNDPMSSRTQRKKPVNHFTETRRLLRNKNWEMNREIQIYDKAFSKEKKEELQAQGDKYIEKYEAYKTKIENGMKLIRSCRRHYMNAVHEVNVHEKDVRKKLNRNRALVSIKVHQKRLDHLQDNCYRVQCQVNVIMHENRVLMEQIREQLVEFGNYIIQHRTIKIQFGVIRRSMFTMVEEANRDFDRFYACLEKVNFLGSEHEKQNHEFQNALWDAERFHAYDMELEQFHRTKLHNRDDDEKTGVVRSKRYAVFHSHLCTEKIKRYKAGLASLAKYPGGRDIGNFALLYKELDLSCQAEFTRITELDAEVDAIYPQVLAIQEKLEGVFKSIKDHKHDRKLELKKLKAKSETVESKVTKAEHEFELGERSAENVMDSVQNIFDIASAFEGSVLGLLGSQGNIITPRNLEPALHVLEHRISELLYMKAAYTLRKGVQVQGKPLPVIGVPLKRKGEAVSTNANEKSKANIKPIGKPKSHGGIFKPRVYADAGNMETENVDIGDSDAEPVSFEQIRLCVGLEMDTSKMLDNIMEEAPSSDTESLEPAPPPPPDENEGSQFFKPERVISTQASIASIVPEQHSTHAIFFQESVDQIAAEFTSRRPTISHHSSVSASHHASTIPGSAISPYPSTAHGSGSHDPSTVHSTASGSHHPSTAHGSGSHDPSTAHGTAAGSHHPSTTNGTASRSHHPRSSHDSGSRHPPPTPPPAPGNAEK